LAVVVTYIFDITQTKTAIYRNYPVIGHFRYFFEHLGEFFRQYFFAMDREELWRNHARTVTADGPSVVLDERFPPVKPAQA
jgi:hypothetical protein